MTPVIKTELLDPTFLRSILDLEDDQVVWRFTRRKATFPGLFKTPDQVMVGVFSMDADDCSIALQTGKWLEGASDRPEPHIRRGYFEMAWHLMERNFKAINVSTPEMLKGTTTAAAAVEKEMV